MADEGAAGEDIGAYYMTADVNMAGVGWSDDMGAVYENAAGLGAVSLTPDSTTTVTDGTLSYLNDATLADVMVRFSTMDAFDSPIRPGTAIVNVSFPNRGAAIMTSWGGLVGMKMADWIVQERVKGRSITTSYKYLLPDVTAVQVFSEGPWEGKASPVDVPDPDAVVVLYPRPGEPMVPPPNQCPPGTTGTPPDCKSVVAAVCPPGTTGTPPNCVVEPKKAGFFSTATGKVVLIGGAALVLVSVYLERRNVPRARPNRRRRRYPR